METKRKYNSESRCAQAVVTRRVILVAARRLFASQGFDKTTIGSIAAAAHVSAPTVYALFKSKEGILRELINEAVFNDRYKSLVDETASSHDPPQALRIAAHIARMVHDAQESEIGLIRGASVISPELRALVLGEEDVRYKRQQFVILILQKEGLLVDTLSTAHARDILWSLTSREIYRMLVVEKGWTSDEYEEWLSRTLLQTLVGHVEEEGRVGAPQRTDDRTVRKPKPTGV
jgi:AcrR family transcriptional regulator